MVSFSRTFFITSVSSMADRASPCLLQPSEASPALYPLPQEFLEVRPILDLAEGVFTISSQSRLGPADCWSDLTGSGHGCGSRDDLPVHLAPTQRWPISVWILYASPEELSLREGSPRRSWA